MQNIETFLKDTIEKYTGICVNDKDKNVMEAGVMPLEFLYVINEIEKAYGITAKEMLRDSDYTILSILNLAKRISNIVYGN